MNHFIRFTTLLIILISVNLGSYGQVNSAIPVHFLASTFELIDSPINYNKAYSVATDLNFKYLEIEENELVKTQDLLAESENNLRELRAKLVWSFILISIISIIFLIYLVTFKVRTGKKLKKLSMVVSKTNNAILISDSTGKIEWVNEGFTKLFGYNLQQLIEEQGKTLPDFSNDSRIKQRIKEAVETGEPVIYSVKNDHRNGRSFWSQTTLNPIKNDKGSVTKLVVYDTEINELKRAENKIVKQHKLLKTKNLQITDSIEYAKRIQTDMFASKEKVKELFQNVCIYQNPKDIVSGDFYWIYQIGNKKFMAVVDCTGHGVPGAFMTIIGLSILNQIMDLGKTLEPAGIIKELNTRLRKILDSESNSKEGMDIGIIMLENDRLEFAGTHISCHILNQDGKQELKGSHAFVGMNDSLEVKQQQTKVQKNDSIYLFTDGYPDQKGGPNGKKYYYASLISFLEEIKDHSPETQEIKMQENFTKWKGKLEQMDDVLLVGIKIK